MSKILNLQEGQTLFVDGVPVLKVEAINHRPYKFRIKAASMLKLTACKGEQKGISVVPDNTEEYSLGDTLSCKDLSVMFTKVNAGPNVNYPTLRVSCKSVGEDFEYTTR